MVHNPRFWAFLIGIVFIALKINAQATDRKIEFGNLELEGDHNRYSRGTFGILLTFDINFSWTESNLSDQGFDLTYKIEQKGQVLPGPKGEIREAARVYARNRASDANMSITGVEIFVPYSDIPLESGQQDIDFVFSLKNRSGNYPDCDRLGIRFKHIKTIIYPIEEQEFDFQNISLNYHPIDQFEERPFLLFESEVINKYGLGQIKEESYELYWILKDDHGNIIYDSQKSSTSFDQKVILRPSIRDNKTRSSLKTKIYYYELKAEGPTKATLYFYLLGTEGGPKEIYSLSKTFDFPTKYNFADQEFSVSNVLANAKTIDGVQGYEFNFEANAKLNSVLRNPEKGDYYFFVQLFDETGKQIIQPNRAPRFGGNTTKLQDGFLPNYHQSQKNGHLFVPAYMISSSVGGHKFSYALMVSDKNLGTNFPILHKGTFEGTKPQEISWQVNLEHLVMKDDKYDTEFIPISSRLPELQYSFNIGNDRFFKSEYVKNNLSAVPGGTSLLLSKGDKMRLVLYDVDSGFFNESDFLGSWILPYPETGDAFTTEKTNEGQLSTMKIVGKKL